MSELQAAGSSGEQRGRDVERAVKSRRAEHDFVWAFLGVLHEIFEFLIGLLIIDDQHAWIGDESRDRDEVGACELWCAPEQFVDFGETGDRSDVQKQRIAVWLRIGDELRADRARGAGFGFDHHRFLHHRLHDRGERPPDHVRRATRRERVDHDDRVRRVGRVLRERCFERDGRGGGAEDEAASIHCCPPESSQARARPAFLRAAMLGGAFRRVNRARLRHEERALASR